MKFKFKKPKIFNSFKKTDGFNRSKKSEIFNGKNILVKLHIKVAEKDKKLLLILVIFLLAAGYYVLLLEPLTKMNAEVSIKLQKQRKKLLVAKTKLGGLTNYRRMFYKLEKNVKVIEKSNLMPSIKATLQTKMKAVLSAAEKASVQISSLKPINSVLESEYGKATIINDKYFAIQGKANLASILNFLRNLWGTELVELDLTSDNKSGMGIRYYIKITFLPKSNYKFDFEANKNEPFKNFGVKDNIFTIIVPPPPPRPPGPPPPPPKPVHHINNAKILGIADFAGVNMVIIKDENTNRVEYLVHGDKFRESKIAKITQIEVVFLFSDGETVTLKLPKQGLGNIISNGDGEPTKKPGHLGILAETLTEELAKQYNEKFIPGLLVISTGSHSDVFKKGDILVSINGTATPNFDAALKIMNKIYAGDELKVELSRKGEMISAKYKAD